MDSTFIYDRYVTGKDFIGRKQDCVILGNLLSQGENVALWEPPKTGKMSLIQQTLFNMRMGGMRFVVGELTLLNIRSIEEFVERLGSTVIRTFATTPHEYKDISSRLLAGTHLVYDPARHSDYDEVLSSSWELDEGDIKAVLTLPFRLAEEKGQRIFLILDEFQNIMRTEDGEKVIKIFEQVLREQENPQCSFIFSGSMINAMKEIFAVKKFFHRQVEHFPLRTVDGKVIVEHIVRGFLSGGKVVDRELLDGACVLFRNNLCYMNHFASICDYMSKGYITEPVLVDSLGKLISIHEPRFKATMNDMTTFQLGLLSAILDGHTRFSSAEVINKYGLNSSANVRRIKDALMKKEVITFDEKDEPHFEDPLFEYWAGKYFFEKKKK